MIKQKYLDSEEQELMESLENDGWKSTNDLDRWKTILSKAADNTLSKDQRINIRITKNDLDGIKIKAAEEGLPYQTLVASIIHKYVTGRLTENRQQ